VKEKMDTGTTSKKVGVPLSPPRSGTYFASVKVKGKQFRQSLQTDHLPEATPKLADFKQDLERIDPPPESKNIG
jgi:hypothetical protein